MNAIEMDLFILGVMVVGLLVFLWKKKLRSRFK